MKTAKLQPGEWGVRGPIEFEVPYGIPADVEYAFKEDERACFKDAKNSVGRFNQCRTNSRERKIVRPMLGAIAILPYAGVLSDQLEKIVENLTALAGYTAADAYELAAWVKRVERRKLSPDILFAPCTFTRTARDNIDLLCYVKTLRRCEFLNVSQGSLTSEYGPAMVRGDNSHWLFKSHMTAGVLCTKPFNQ